MIQTASKKMAGFFRKKAVLISGQEFNSFIPVVVAKVIFTDAKCPSREWMDVSEEKNDKVVAWVEESTMYVSTQKKGKKVVANRDFARGPKSNALKRVFLFGRIVKSKTSKIQFINNCQLFKLGRLVNSRKEQGS